VGSFVLQPGIYQVQFLAPLVYGCGELLTLSLDQNQVAQWYPSSLNNPTNGCPDGAFVFEGIIVGLVTVQVQGQNQTLKIGTLSAPGATGTPSILFNNPKGPGSPWLTLTQLQ
jgi:hypothetical protein